MHNSPKIVFILATQSNTNNIKRIEAFINAGYETEVFAFSRGESLNRPNAFDIKILCEFSNDLPYWRRLKLMYKGIKQVLDKTKGQDCIYYLIRNDVALIFSYISNRPYIFEEADMTHANFGNKLLADLTERRIKQIIKRSVVSVFRSEGFVRFHFGDNVPDNVIVIPNKLSPHVKDFPMQSKKDIDINHLRFGFVGVMRHRATYIFAETLLKYFPQHEFHFYGDCDTETDRQLYYRLKQYKKCFFHGRFKSPDDLTSIYCDVDILLSTYEPNGVNARYLESNKIYEAIYFDTPVIVSSNTFLAEKVKDLGIGFDIDALSTDEVMSFISNLSVNSLTERIENIKLIDKDSCISKGYMKEFDKRIKNIQ